MYDNLLMIYYSGTGNSRKVSEWINETAMESGMNTVISSYEHFDPQSISAFEGKTLIGFFSATHGFNLPHSMIRFLIRFHYLKGSDIFIGNTRAGLKLSKLFVPGISGIALFLAALIMWIKGYKVRALYPVDLPSNWISLHPGLKPKVIDSMFDHYRNLTREFASKVLSGQKIFLKAIITLPLDLLIAPIAVGYYFVGRYMLAKSFIANENCDNCGLCVKQCSTGSIIITDNRPFWKLSCESCMHCMNFCPKRAIETAHTFFFAVLFVLIYLIYPPLSELIQNNLFSFLGGTGAGLMYTVIRWVITVFVFAIAYRIMHYLTRYRFFSRLISYSSLTRFRFWRRYRAR